MLDLNVFRGVLKQGDLWKILLLLNSKEKSFIKFFTLIFPKKSCRISLPFREKRNQKQGNLTRHQYLFNSFWTLCSKFSLGRTKCLMPICLTKALVYNLHFARTCEKVSSSPDMVCDNWRMMIQHKQYP